MLVEAVPANAWLPTVIEVRGDGFDYFDWLGCTDEIGRSETFRVTVVLRDLRAGGAALRMLTTAVPRERAVLDSLRTEFAGAGWHEREAAELFGLEFRGGDARRLLLGASFAGSPLRKDEVLGSRVALSWPGAKEPGESDASPSRRRMIPPGVPDPQVWGSRDPAEAAATPDEVAASAVGGRVRRRGR